MTAETQGLAQGFNDDLVNVPADEVAPPRPRPTSEAIDVSGSLARDRERAQADVDAGEILTVGNPGPGLRSQEQPEPAPQADQDVDPWENFTKREIAEALRGTAPDDETLAAYDHNERKVTKPQLVLAAESAGLKVDAPAEPGISEESQARIQEIDLRLSELAPEGSDEDADAEREALLEELDKLQGENASE